MKSRKESSKTDFTFLPAIKSSSAGSRAVGGKATSMVLRPPKTHTTAATASNVAVIQRRRRDPAYDPEIREGDLNKGISSLLERGLLPKGFDLDEVVGGQYDSKPLNVGGAKMHRHIDQFKRQEVLTSNLGFGQMMNVKLDTREIEKIPAKAPLSIPKEIPTAPLSTSVPPQPTEELPLGPGAEVKARDDARTYQQLLDLYSLHEFIIRKGQALRNTPEFVSYQRSFQSSWGAIESIIRQLEELLSAFGVSLAYIDGKKVAQLATVDLGAPSREELMSCIANRAEVEPSMVSQIQQFRNGSHGHDVAATKIQSMSRMWSQRRAYTHLKAATRAAMLIQRQWNVHKAHMKTRKTISVVKEGMVFRWRERMDQFVRDWPRIRESKRLILHIPSLSYPADQCRRIPFYNCFQASQMMRLADLRDPLVELVIVSPFKVEDEALQYYLNTLKMAGAPDPESRLLVLVPEHAKRLPDNLSLTKMILFSSKIMKVLSSLTKGKSAYIVPGVVSNDELLLAAKLNIPILGPEPRVAQVLGSKSGSRTVFESADVATPVGAYRVKDVRDMYMILARFISEYRDVSRWLVKIDNEAGSRGHAYFDVARIKAVTESGEVPSQVLAERVLQELREHASRRATFVSSIAYSDWQAFTAAFDAAGGCVEAYPPRIVASPTANLFIEPDGTVNLVSVVENVFAPQLSVLGCGFPQTATPYDAIRDAALSIGSAAFRKKIMGYVSVDFVVHERGARDKALRLWAVDLDIGLTTNASMHKFVELLTGAEFDPKTGSAITSTGQPLTYLYSGLVYNPYIGAIRHASFFNQCRQRGLSFDTVSRTGVLFHLVDTLLKGCFGAICIGSTHNQSVALLQEVQQLIQGEIAKDADNVLESNYGYFVQAVKKLSVRSISERKRK